MNKINLIISCFITCLGLSSCAECVIGNCYYGRGTYIYADGEKYVGEWQSDQRHGRGTFTSKDGEYVGQWKDNIPSGYGIWTFADGQKYVGELKDGKFHGRGIWTFADGRKYDGEWQSDQRHGRGTFIYADGQRYVGEWKDNGFHEGTYTSADGEKYVGEWKDGLPHGKGIFTRKDGSKQIGEWENNNLVRMLSIEEMPYFVLASIEEMPYFVLASENNISTVKKIVVNEFINMDSQSGGKIISIIFTPENYFIFIDPMYTKVYNDITGDNFTPVQILGYTLATKTEGKFAISVPRSNKKLYFYNINKFGNDAVMDLTKYDKNLKARTPRKDKEDNEKPNIIINYPIFTKNLFRTDELFITVEGKILDKVGVLNLTINNEPVAINNRGLFKKRIKLNLGQNSVLLIATDINNNVANRDFVIIRDEIIQDAQFSDIDFPESTSNIDNNTIAVVFGIENYRNAPSVSYAVNDADIFREYLIKRFGLKRENIYLRLDEQATKGEFYKVFSPNGWINRHSSSNVNVIVYFAGHGAPDVKSKEAYLIPFDGDPNYATSTGYLIKDIYENLGKLNVNSVTIILDACFSGASRDNQPLLADSRPFDLSVKNNIVPENTIVFSASSGNEISSAYKQKKHGIFTYFFLKGLNGNADKNQDRTITMQEMYNYLSENVSIQARRMGREQTPQLHGKNKGKLLIKY